MIIRSSVPSDALTQSLQSTFTSIDSGVRVGITKVSDGLDRQLAEPRALSTRPASWPLWRLPSRWSACLVSRHSSPDSAGRRSASGWLWGQAAVMSCASSCATACARLCLVWPQACLPQPWAAAS